MADDSNSILNEESADDKVTMTQSQEGYVKTAAYNYSKCKCMKGTFYVTAYYILASLADRLDCQQQYLEKH
jgi:hypothetical protein